MTEESLVLNVIKVLSDLKDMYKLVGFNSDTVKTIEETSKALGINIDTSCFTKENCEAAEKLESSIRMALAEKRLDVVSSMALTDAGFDFTKDMWRQSFILTFKDIDITITNDRMQMNPYYFIATATVTFNRPYGKASYALYRRFQCADFYSDLYNTYVQARDSALPKLLKSTADKSLVSLNKDIGLDCSLNLNVEFNFDGSIKIKPFSVYASDKKNGFAIQKEIANRIREPIREIRNECANFKGGSSSE
ncbi:MAG TPA: hypothetical protein VK190_02710 [Pseudoneobacillus sp.]|jgi:hypothetical protein|nr:hypothetical protein [Pseudoneobacillus sp.]